MATPRKPSAGSKKPKAAKSSAKKRVAKAAPRRPAPRASAKPKLVAKAAKGAPKVVGRPAVKGPTKPLAPRVIGRPAVKGPTKPAAPRVIGRPAVKGPPKPSTPVKVIARKLVPVTPGMAAKILAAKAAPAKGKPGSKSKLVVRPPAEVKPLGVLPPESMAKPKDRPRALPKRVPAPPPPKPKVVARPIPSVKKGDDRLTDEDLKHFEQRLLTERARIMKEMGHLETTVLKVNPRDSAGDLSGYSFHMADAGTDAMEREKAFDIASKEGRLLMEIDAALRRLYNGEYGNCEVTGKPISRARLEALPWARLSLEEQEKREREERANRGTV